ncbi:MAG: type II toxin-antitoxin system PemK/MazF family toxin [Tissierellia bacterium]|nr:type II toxin-antitoxin system PemK/MazF family toxin [Tissierellia bacterium]
MRVVFNNLYLATIEGTETKVLILYNLSANHYVGLIVTDIKEENSNYISCIDKYIDFSKIIDIARKEINSPIYSKGKILSIDFGTRNYITKNLKKTLISKLDTSTNHRIPDDLSFLKWTCKKQKLNSETIPIDLDKLKAFQICWMDFGFNVGSELRKIRPAVLWRSTTDKKMWTVIPLSTKCKEDSYYFHYDLTSLNDCSVKIESLMNLSANRIIEPYYIKNRIAYLNKNDYNNIKNILKKYYIFEK